jgi:hypothetical protein
MLHVYQPSPSQARTQPGLASRGKKREPDLSQLEIFTRKSLEGHGKNQTTRALSAMSNA